MRESVLVKWGLGVALGLAGLVMVKYGVDYEMNAAKIAGVGLGLVVSPVVILGAAASLLA